MQTSIYLTASLKSQEAHSVAPECPFFHVTDEDFIFKTGRYAGQKTAHVDSDIVLYYLDWIFENSDNPTSLINAYMLKSQIVYELSWY